MRRGEVRKAGPSDPAQGRLRVTTLGVFSARADKREIGLVNRKSRALLGYLVLSEAAEEARDRLIGLLWSETEEERARASLRQALYEIRAALEPIGLELVTSKSSVMLDRSRIEIDLWDLIGEAKAGRAHAALLATERPIDGLLAEFENIDPAFRVWLVAKRQTFHDRLIHDLEEALRAASPSEEMTSELARAILNLDPSHEEAARALMRARARIGDVGGALTVYKRLWDLLQDEYDVEPSRETQELVAQLKLAQPDSSHATADAAPPPGRAQSQPVSSTTAMASPSAAPGAGSRPKKLIVAVGRFDPAGIPPERAYLVEGFRRELISNLLRFREWSVREAAPVSGVAAGLAAHEYVVEANALQGSRDVRLVIMLRDTQSQEYVWSDQYQLGIDGWVDAQLLLVKRIAAALNVYLSAGRLELRQYREDLQLRAYDRWLFAQSMMHGWSPQGFHDAAEILKKIIAEAPDFSPAFSSLAQLQNGIHFSHPGVFRDQQRTEQALGYAKEATRLDPVDSRGQLALGWAHAMAKQHDLAETHHMLAKELNQNDPWTITSVAFGHASRGQMDEARNLATEALDLSIDPGPHHWGYHQQIRFLSADYVGSMDAAAGAEGIVPTALAWKAAALGQLGRKQEAQTEVGRYVEQIRGSWFGTVSATDRNVARWTMHCVPLKRHEDWEHLRDGLALAGMPVSDLRHNAW
jgi:DNA-binding SARP family transcriptional activator/TolB-like protein